MELDFLNQLIVNNTILVNIMRIRNMGMESFRLKMGGFILDTGRKGRYMGLEFLN